MSVKGRPEREHRSAQRLHPAPIPFYDLAAQHASLASALDAAWTRVLASNRLVLGPELEAFEQTPLGKKYPSTIKAFRDAWERFTPFLAFPPALRRVIYTTNAIESLNYQLRKVTKNRGHFPNDAAVVKLLWLAICNIEDKGARERAKERGKPAAQRKASHDWSRVRSRRTGSRPSVSSRSPTPSASNPYL